MKNSSKGSPERVNPGDRANTIPNIVKITSGSTLDTAEFVINCMGALLKQAPFLPKAFKSPKPQRSLKTHKGRILY